MSEPSNKIEIYTDSDWAGDIPSRRSTSGGILCYGGCVIRTWSTLQKVNALSSAEAEYLSMIKGVQEVMALQTLLGELGLKVTITVYTDSSAAKASAEKPELLHMKHVQLVQEDFVVIEKLNTMVIRRIC